MVIFQKNKYKIYIVLLFVVALLIQAPITNKFKTSISENSRESPQISAPVSGSMQWLNNTGFDNEDDWVKEINTDDLNPDLNASIDNGLAKYEVLGEKHTFVLGVDPRNSTEMDKWQTTKKTQYEIYPDSVSKTSEGFIASHRWTESAGGQDNNSCAVRWVRQVEMPVDMSDYKITSASFMAQFNATVEEQSDGSGPDDSYGGIEVPPSDYTTSGQDDTWDFAYYSAEISSEDNPTMKTLLAYNRTNSLGTDVAPMYVNNKPAIYRDTNMTLNLNEDLLISSIESALSFDNRNFTLYLGIDIFCADNFNGADQDNFSKLVIRSLNLTFTYEKYIDELDSVSWNQYGKNVSSLTTNPIQANSAKLRFQYKIDKSWSVYTPKQNSELKCYLNGNPYIIPIKLIDISDTEYNVTEISLTPPAINEGVNLSIEVIMKDEFELNQTITIYIDNVTLDISYTIYAPDVAVSSDGGGGGGTRIIRGEDYSWLVYTLTAGIIALMISIVAYEKHFKIPPMVRKIRKLKKKIRKGRKVKSLLVNSREKLIRDSFEAKTHQVLEADVIKSEVIDKLEKGGS
ncbi:MAG: hypothetical protein ACFFAO_03605 [Candidatus Hermodarchaeota archaeon]